MIDLSHQPCLVCGRISSDVLHQTTYPEFGCTDTFVMRRCNGCGLLFNSPRLEPDKLANLYDKNYYFFARSVSSEFRRIIPMYFRTLGWMDQTQTRTKCLLDIGCGRGYFPAVLKLLGWDARGIEVSSDAARFARQHFALDVFNGTIEQYAGNNQGQFSVVTAIDVVEHTPAPHDFIRAAASLVEKDGWLIIDTPNANAANIANEGVHWKGFNPFHIFLFSIENLATLLARHGFVVERSFSYNNAPSVGMRKKLVGGMKRIGLFPLVSRIYFRSKQWRAIFDDAPALSAENAALKIKLTSPERTVDAGPFAATKTGNNIIVIARRRQSAARDVHKQQIDT